MKLCQFFLFARRGRSAVVGSALAAATVLSSGCRNGCSLGLSTTITPTDPTIRVGETITPDFVVSSECDGRIQTTQWWQSQDTSIVAADSATGRLTGRAIGTAVVWVYSVTPSTAYRWNTSVRVVP